MFNLRVDYPLVEASILRISLNLYNGNIGMVSRKGVV